MQLRNRYPDAKIIAHPECEEQVLKHVDFICSTTDLLKYATTTDFKEYIVVTESGILHQMQKAAPGKVFIAAPPFNNCACNDCPHMKIKYFGESLPVQEKRNSRSNYSK